MGQSVRQLWAKKEETVLATSSKVVDLLALSSFSKLEYIVEYRDTTSSKTKTLKMAVTNGDTEVCDSVYAKQGDPMDIAITARRTASNFELEITNNEAFDIDLSFARLKL